MTDRLRTRSARLPASTDPLEVQALHCSRAVSLYDVRCRPCDFGRGPEEWSRADQIVLPRRGVFERETRGETTLADANHVLFFNHDESYRVSHPAGCGDDCSVVVFDAALLHEAVRQRDPSWMESADHPFRFAQALSSQRAFVSLEQLRRALHAAERDVLAIDEAALELLDALLADAYAQHGSPVPRSNDATRRAHREQARCARLFLAEHFREELSLQEIARAVHCSPFHLARLFRRHAGLTLHQYRHRLRLREALLRIADGERNLSALALELGFSSHSHFTDCFRQSFGLAPANYRKLASCTFGARETARRSLETSKNLEVAARRRP
jgi:AraC family transcriptional regulator